MTPLAYHCKICKKPGVAYYDPECPISNIELWRKSLCCDKCYQFRDKFMACKRGIERLCIGLKNNRTNDERVRQEVERKIRDNLIKITKQLATLCSDFYRVQNIWDVEMVNILFENPIGCNKAIDKFHAEYAREARKPRELVERSGR